MASNNAVMTSFGNLLSASKKRKREKDELLDEISRADLSSEAEEDDADFVIAAVSQAASRDWEPEAWCSAKG